MASNSNQFQHWSRHNRPRALSHPVVDSAATAGAPALAAGSSAQARVHSVSLGQYAADDFLPSVETVLPNPTGQVEGKDLPTSEMSDDEDVADEPCSPVWPVRPLNMKKMTWMWPELKRRDATCLEIEKQVECDGSSLEKLRRKLPGHCSLAPSEWQDTRTEGHRKRADELVRHEHDVLCPPHFFLSFFILYSFFFFTLLSKRYSWLSSSCHEFREYVSK